jgi:hypothetical protein
MVGPYIHKLGIELVGHTAKTTEAGIGAQGLNIQCLRLLIDQSSCSESR